MPPHLFRLADAVEALRSFGATHGIWHSIQMLSFLHNRRRPAGRLQFDWPGGLWQALQEALGSSY
ncbi:hypothetical protein AvCA_25720 [Azotobacter vinelandii CA]|uniref:Uncharacterized protein n=2 Tax=Azotobacter vinelandii TaxID=354 RepID=C1DIS1_AZOVD|nr:hypothetical protein Avin_25720 [Azotobacter vinelandii DJ]AGK16630.1 hypothetical protein AvCA_25720 [Azotobacter vinelandii CA]AGK20717.1 hypothetical protein AvCA6_25720 [Azotobacter vinelandii CA6]